MNTRKSQQDHGDGPIRRSDGGGQATDEIDVEGAIDASSDIASLDDLMRRGFSRVKVLDRNRIGSLIKEAVCTAVEDRATGLLEEKLKLQEESQKRFEQLLAEYAPTEPDELAPENETSSSGIGASFQTETIADGGRLGAVEQRMQKLLGMLERAERVAERLSTAAPRLPRTHVRIPDQRRQELLQKIFEYNLTLQATE